MTIRQGWGPRGQAGIGIVELLLALSLSAMLLTALYASYFRTQRAASAVMGRVEGRQGARAAIQIMERDLRMAGSGWGRMTVNGVYSGAATTLRGVNPGYGASRSDSISAIGGWDVNTTLRSSMATQTQDIPCVTTAGFAVGDLAVVSNGTTAHLFQVTQVTTSPANLQVSNSSPYNSGTRSSWPAGGYAAATRVFKAGWVTYRFDSTSYVRPSLVRQEVGKAPSMIAYDVERFQVLYRMADGTTTRNPTNLPMVEQVVPILKTRNTSGSAALSDSIWAAIRPRTF